MRMGMGKRVALYSLVIACHCACMKWGHSDRVWRGRVKGRMGEDEVMLLLWRHHFDVFAMLGDHNVIMMCI